MKKVAAVFRIILMVMFVAGLTLVPVKAAGLEGTEVSLINDESGYKIIVPGFIDVKTVTLYEDEEVNVLVMKAPEKDSNGNYPIFEIVTTDKNAHSIESFPGITDEGQIGDFQGVFNSGRLIYAPSLAIDGDLKDVSKDKIFIFDFVVYDKDGDGIISIESLYFTFDNNAEPSAPQAEPKVVTAKPTSAKVVVDGKNVAFEAYEIDGYNYFKLRDLAMAINGSDKQFEVDWDGANINLISDSAYTPVGNELVISGSPTAKEAKLTQAKIYLDGEEVQLTAYNIGGNNYFKLRDIGEIIDFGVTWDGNINLDTANSYTE